MDMHYISKKNQTENMFAAVKKNGYALQYVKTKQNMSEEYAYALYHVYVWLR